MNGNFPSHQIDHVNRNRQDDRWENLRHVTALENNQNTHKKSTNKSGYKGVSLHKTTKKWIAQICFKGKSRNLGYFESPEAASVAYKQAASKLHSINPEGEIQ
jgi:HNH endonuclease/AP2 domain